jgi:hypothetical protein
MYSNYDVAACGLPPSAMKKPLKVSGVTVGCALDGLRDAPLGDGK